MTPSVLAAAVAVLAATALPALAPAGAAPRPRAAARAGTLVDDWVTYHGDRARTGYAPHAPAYRGGAHVSTRMRLDGAVYASPLVAHGLTILATENDTVYAFGPANRLIWKRHLAAPSPAGERPCGNIDPLGITGTPVYSAATGIVYVAAELGGNPPSHLLYGLRVTSGRLAFTRGLDFPGTDPRVMQERGALTIAAGRVWVPFGGLSGDCGAYKGRLIGYPLDGAGRAARYTVPTAREAGIWAPPGPSVDRAGNLFVAVGNGASGPGDPYDHSDSVLKISGRATLLDSFSPRSWAQDNSGDADLGSQGPALVGRYVFSAGKSGTAYTLRRSALGGIGGIGGQVSTHPLCRSFGGTAVFHDTVYVPCGDGIRAVMIGPGGRMRPQWRAASSIAGTPVLSAGTVWALDVDNGVLKALGRFTGRVKASVPVGAVSRFATPALSGRRILVGTLRGLTVVRY